MSDRVADEVAERLERAGLWRRATARWLAVMVGCQTEKERDWIRRRREYCLSNLSRRRRRA